MALRFQQSDEVDKRLKEGRLSIKSLLIFSLILAIAFCVVGWFHGDSFGEVAKYFFVSWGVIAFWVYEVGPVYFEYRARSKETYGKVSAIEEEVHLLREERSALLECLATLEDRLFERLEQVENKIEYSQSEEFFSEINKGKLPRDVASEIDVSNAVTRAIRETGATSPTERGLVIKAARGFLKGKNFDEHELLSMVSEVDFLKSQTK